MSAAAGAPRRPLAMLAVAVLGVHALVLRGTPPAIDWRHLRGAMTFDVRDVRAAGRARDVPVPPPVATAPTARTEPPPATRPAPRPTTARRVTQAPGQATSMPASTPAAPVPLPALRLPGASVWHYAVTATVRGTTRTGSADLAWSPAGDRYEASLQVTLPGGPNRRLASAGALTPAGLEPLRFSDRLRSEEAAHFDRAQRRIVFSSNRPDAPLQPGAQDRLSVLLQVAAMVAADPARFGRGTSVTLQTATAREAADWTFAVDGEELLTLPGGSVPALRLTRAPQREYDLRIELWLAPGADYGPVRLRLTPPNGEWLDIQWSGTDK